MREGWVETTLGNVLTRRSDRLGKGPEPRILTVTEGAGLVDQLAHWGRRVATDDVSDYKVVDPGDVVYNVYLLWKGAIGQNLFPERGVTSPVYEVFTPEADVESRYLGLLLRSPLLLSAFDSISIGSIQRRRRAPWQDFERISILLPPLAEQRRIVDLIGAIDDAIASAEATASNARRSATSMLIHPMWEIAETVPLESVFEHVIGGTWGDPPGLSDVPVLALGPKSYAGRVEVDADTATVRSLPSKRAAGRMLLPGDIVLERSGGSPTQPVGRVIRMSNEGASNVVPSDFQRLLRPDPSKAHPDFVFWSMWANYESGVVVPFQKATTSIRNLNIPQYLSQVLIALPAHSEQVKFAALAESYMTLVKGHEHQASQLLELRSSLLTALLSGQHEIPESYDELMGVAS